MNCINFIEYYVPYTIQNTIVVLHTFGMRCMLITLSFVRFFFLFLSELITIISVKIKSIVLYLLIRKYYTYNKR